VFDVHNIIFWYLWLYTLRGCTNYRYLHSFLHSTLCGGEWTTLFPCRFTSRK